MPTNPTPSVPASQEPRPSEPPIAREQLRGLLEEAIHLMQNWIDEHDGKDPFGLLCGRCDGAIPIEHSFGCRVARTLQLIDHAAAPPQVPSPKHAKVDELAKILFEAYWYGCGMQWNMSDYQGTWRRVAWAALSAIRGDEARQPTEEDWKQAKEFAKGDS